MLERARKGRNLSRSLGPLHVRELGAGPVVLLLHGSPQPAEHLAPLASALSDHYRVLLPDLPGYGSSPSLAGRYRFEDAHRLLEEALLVRRAFEISVVGFSTGAYRACWFASSIVRVRAIVCLSGFAHVPPEQRRAYKSSAAAVREGEAIGELLADGFFSPAYAKAHREQVAEVSRWPRATSMEVLSRELEALADAPDLRAIVRGAKCRVAARVGALDAMTPVERSKEISARAEIAKSSGHALLFEDFAETLEFVRRSLQC